jgi:CDP-glycerol glycerophosphotransferase (TagB/SpsB family)
MKIISRAFKTIKILIIGWGVVAPMSHLLHFKKNLVLFIGKNGGLFFDNVKYLYLYLHSLKQNEVDYYFFTENKSVYDTLKQHNLPVIFHPTWRSILALVRANIVISCDTRWIKNYRHNITSRAKRVQLWHGIPLKKIGSLKPDSAKRQSRLLGRISDAIRDKHRIYDLFVSTSDYYTKNVFAKAFRSKNILESGYPRNDIFFKNRPDELDLLEADTKSIDRINNLRNNGYKAILYAPTLGDPMGNAIKAGFLNLGEISSFAQKYKLLFVFKFHPSADCSDESAHYDNIIFYNSYKDIQPLLSITDILVTDYSSVYIDYLLLDRPIVFFAYNRDKHLEAQEGLIFDYESATPGPVCISQEQLQETLKNYTIGRTDEFAVKRKEIRKLAFKYEDSNSSERIWNFIKMEFLKNS